MGGSRSAKDHLANLASYHITRSRVCQFYAVVCSFVIVPCCLYNTGRCMAHTEDLMKILAILAYYSPHWTGLTVHAVRVAEGLAARGHQVTVLTSRHDPALPRDEVLNGVRVVRLQSAARVSRGMITPAFPYAAATLIAAHDVVQIHTPLPEAPIVALLCRAFRRPLLMTHHGDLVMPQGVFNQTLQRVGFVVLRSAGVLADAVTSYSHDYAQHSRLLRSFADKVTCVYPPVDIPHPDPVAIARWRAELGLEGRQVIGFAGRWVEEKGFDYLLEALPLIRERCPAAHLVYAGEQHVVYEDFYERCLPLITAQQEHLTFLGLIREPQRMADFYGMCDVFALPSRTDMMALVQVEAMMCGTPVVASDIPGARVVVRETGFGRLAPPHAPGALADMLVEVLQHRERYRPSREAVCEVFDTERSIRDYEALMIRLIRDPGYGRARSRTARHARAHQARQALFSSLPATLGAGGARADVGAVRSEQVPRTSSALSDADRAQLETLLQNEADMAFRRRALTLLAYLDLQDGERVLDCGCGMGVYLMMMGRLRKLRLFGVDGDVGRLQWAQREQLSARLTEVDIHQLPYQDGMFDKVLMSEVLEHMADDRAALREVFRVLKPGGILALSVPHANYPFVWDPISKVIEACGLSPMRGAGPIAGIWSNHFRLYHPDQVCEVMTDAGFTIEVLEQQTHYAFPFIHTIVYSIGKPLIEHNLLPKRLRDSADRFRGEQNSGSLLNPINLGVRLFRFFDAPNERLQGNERSFVNVVVKARKPEVE